MTKIQMQTDIQEQHNMFADVILLFHVCEQ